MEEAIAADRYRRSENRSIPVAIALLRDGRIGCVQDGGDVAVTGYLNCSCSAIIDHKVVWERIVCNSIATYQQRVGLRSAGTADIKGHGAWWIHDYLSIAGH